jgi:hypothetical protein
MIVSSWTHDMTGINYFVKAKEIGRANFLENEEWELMQATGLPKTDFIAWLRHIVNKINCDFQRVEIRCCTSAARISIRCSN